VRRFLSTTSEDYFEPEEAFSDEILFERIDRYENAVRDLSAMIACIAYWAKPWHGAILRKALSRSADRLGELQGGKQVWIELRWYPIVMEFYSSGIAAVSGARYDSLREIFYTPVPATRHGEITMSLVERVSDAVLEFTDGNLFNRLRGHEKHLTPMSEYLHKILPAVAGSICCSSEPSTKRFDESKSCSPW